MKELVKAQLRILVTESQRKKIGIMAVERGISSGKMIRKILDKALSDEQFISNID